jgi:hypothetical protein
MGEGCPAAALRLLNPDVSSVRRGWIAYFGYREYLGFA